MTAVDDFRDVFSLLKNAAAEEGFSVVEGNDLSRSDAALHILVGDVGAAVPVRSENNGRRRVSVTHAYEDFAFFRQRAINP